jgi:hypothetical protein
MHRLPDYLQVIVGKSLPLTCLSVTGHLYGDMVCSLRKNKGNQDDMKWFQVCTQWKKVQNWLQLTTDFICYRKVGENTVHVSIYFNVHEKNLERKTKIANSDYCCIHVCLGKGPNLSRQRLGWEWVKLFILNISK